SEGRLPAQDAIVGLDERGPDEAGPIVSLPVCQAEPTQPALDGGRPGWQPRRIEGLKYRRPECRPKPGDTVGSVRGQAAFRLARQRVGTAQQMAECVADDAAAVQQRRSMQRRLDDRLVEAEQDVLKVFVARCFDERI